LKYARLELFLVLVCLVGLSTAATLLVNHFGWTLYYGDAEAHLNIARRILDSRTPGYDQIGTSWLPLPHLLTLLLAGDDRLWRTGLAGAIPSSACFTLAGAFLFAAMRRATKSPAAGFAALGLFALNPNLLYLQATPMTEPVFLAGLMAVLYFTVLFRDTQSFWALLGAAIASLAASLSRYEGWFLIPFLTIYFLFAAKRRRLLLALAFAAIASLAPLYWLAHNWWLYSNPLEFYNGPYSAKAINQRTGPYPGEHDWKKAWLYFRTASLMCTGWGTMIVAATGLLGALYKRLFWPALLASLPAAFYLWSMYLGGAAIFVPQLWFQSYYNTRYGLASLPLLAVAGACTTLLTTSKWRILIALAAIAIGAAPWLILPRPESWICWKESQVNSESRRAWTREAAQVLARRYQRGSGILTSFGDLTGIFRQAGIPLRETLHDGNEPPWMAATVRPSLFLHEEWAIAISGDAVATVVQRATLKTGPRYHLERTIIIKGAPVIEIYKRD
jgi:hypothetical protein